MEEIGLSPQICGGTRFRASGAAEAKGPEESGVQAWGSRCGGAFVPVTPEPCLPPPPPSGLPPLLPAESKAFASTLPTLSVAKATAAGPGKSSGLQVRGLPCGRALGPERCHQGAGKGAGGAEEANRPSQSSLGGGSNTRTAQVGACQRTRQMETHRHQDTG